MAIMDLRAFARLHREVTAPDSDEEALQKRGITNDQIGWVMDAIAEVHGDQRGDQR